MRDAHESHSTTETTTVAVVFVVAGHPYAVPALHTREVLEWRAPRELPGAAPWIEGVINLRGEIIPVCDLAHALGMRASHAQSASSSIVIVETRDGAASVGFTVDEVRAVVSFSSDDIVDAPGVDHPAMAGIIRVGEELVVMLDPQQALAGAGVGALLPASIEPPVRGDSPTNFETLPDDQPEQSLRERPAA